MARKTIPALLSSQLNHLLSHPTLNFKVDHIASGCKNGVYADRFALFIPFCLEYIKWDVIYNAMHPLVAPDVVFSEEDEGFDPLAMVEGEGEMEKSKKSSLYDWDARDPSMLSKLILDLRDMYALYQRKRAADINDERLTFEMNTVLSREGIEVLVAVKDRLEEVKFAVPLLLDTNLSELVPGCPWKQQQKIHLQVIFAVGTKYSHVSSAPHVKLVSTSGLRLLFNIEDVKLPIWLDGMCMAEYIPIVEERIRQHIFESVAAIGARRRFIEALFPLFGTPVEADPVFCRKATVYVCSTTFPFLVHFSLSPQFPRQQPALTLQSCMHSNHQGAPIMWPPLKDYPWSPRWEAQHMAERILNFLSDESLSFKKHCMDSASTIT